MVGSNSIANKQQTLANAYIHACMHAFIYTLMNSTMSFSMCNKIVMCCLPIGQKNSIKMKICTQKTKTKTKY